MSNVFKDNNHKNRKALAWTKLIAHAPYSPEQVYKYQVIKLTKSLRTSYQATYYTHKRLQHNTSKMPGKRNLMVGKWMPTDRLQLMKWAKKEFDKVKASRPEQFAAYKEYFPDADTEDEVLSEFIKNASRMNEIKKKVVLHDSIANLMIAMGKTPEIGMLIIEMFRQQSGMFVELARLDGLKTVDAIFFLNTLITYPPIFIDEDLGMCNI